MEQLSYERPRERLKARGASSLSAMDLLQIIIGSGSSKVSAARLARHIATLFKQGVPTYDELIAVAGLGDAKVCQVLASYEFGRRNLNASISTKVPSLDAPTDAGFKDFYRLTRRYIGYVTFDGADQKIKLRRSMVTPDMSAGLIVRKVFAEALRDNAASITIAIGYRQQTLEPTAFELDIVKGAHEVASLMQIRIIQVVLVSASGYKELRK